LTSRQNATVLAIDQLAGSLKADAEDVADVADAEPAFLEGADHGSSFAGRVRLSGGRLVAQLGGAVLMRRELVGERHGHGDLETVRVNVGDEGDGLAIAVSA
jgi:hypothetical protein